MPSTTTTIVSALFVALARAHSQILYAEGIPGAGSSVGFAVDPSIARNCTTISPCQQDAVLIRDKEITANIVNQCGRTELNGNIDVGENTENAIALGQVAHVKSGTKITMTIHQVNADGAGPYVCDLDETSNSGTISQNLTVTNNVPGVNGFSQAKAQDFNITIQMPDKFKCTGASTGNVCTVRCRNNAVAGPFGGCIAVIQDDTEAKVNTPENIATIQQLDVVLAQVQQDQADFKNAVDANINAGSDEALKNLAVVDAIKQAPTTSVAFPAQTPKVELGGAAAAPAATSAVAIKPKPAAGSGQGKGQQNNGQKNGQNNAQQNKGGNGQQQKRSDGALRWANRRTAADILKEIDME